MMWLQPAIAALLGLWAGLMAHKGWGNYHDGVRPILAEQVDGNLSREELVAFARDANRPFVAGTLGLSALVGVPVAHWVWLPAEALGYRARRPWAAMLGGAVWGLAAWLAVVVLRLGAGALPVPLLPGWERAGITVLVAVLFAPALGAGHRFGLKAGLGALLLSGAGAAAAIVAGWPSPAPVPAVVGGVLAGLPCFLVLVAWDAGRNKGPREPIAGVSRRGPVWALVIQGAVLACAVRAGVFGWSIADAAATGHQWWGASAAVALILAPSFAPQWSAALSSTGVAQLAGLGLTVVAGFLSPSPGWALLLGGAAALLELNLLPSALRFPELREAGESLRWAFGKMTQAGVLAGSVWAAADLLPGGLGPAVVIALVVLNDLLPSPIWNTAAPAWGLLLTGLLANILKVAGGW